MNPRKKLLPIEIALLATLYFPAAVALQMPPEPGKLVVKSTPSGAPVFIDRISRGNTDITFLLVPGRTYLVEVKGEQGLSCSKSVAVSSGQTITWTCTDKGWKQ